MDNKNSYMKSLALTLALGSAASPALATEWVMSTGYPSNNFMTQNIQMFIDEIEKETDGELTIKLYPNNTLTKLDAIRRAVQTGQIQIGETRLGIHSNEDPMYGLAGIPFVASDYDSAWKLMEAQTPYFDKLFDRYGIKALAYQPWPGQGFYTKESVASTGDFAGKRLRIYSTTTQQMGEMLGFEATILPFAEIPQAFSTGLIEALFTSPQTGIDIQAWDNTKYFTSVGAMFTKNAIIVNEDALESLPDDIQAIVVEAGKNATKRGWEMSQKTYEEQLQLLQDKGMTVSEAPEEVMNAMQEVGKELLASWLDDASPEAKSVVDTYLAN